MSCRSIHLTLTLAAMGACSLLFVVACAPFGSDSSATDTPDGSTPTFPSIGLGNGSGGALTIDTPLTLNKYFPLSADVPARSRVLALNDAVQLAVGDVVLVWQMATSDGAPSDQANILLSDGVGRYELARVTKTAVATIEVDRELVGYVAALSQVVTVPQLTELTVRPGGSLVPKTWDGHLGGIVAVLVRGTLTNDGVISADDAGFRGSPAGPNPTTHNKCTAALDGLSDAGYSPRGEGLHVAAYQAAPSGGRGNLLNGGGGGNCHNAGGGGGGQGSAGGQGGRGYPPDSVDGDIGGIGGARLSYTLQERLTLGGGGGGGDRNDKQNSEGARGGGVLFLRADALSGAGKIHANGSTPPLIGSDGAGGGGAAGAILIQVATSASCTVGAHGGDGGSTTAKLLGPGGGGGGGHVLLQAASATCPIDVGSGIAGTNADTTEGAAAHFGATPATSEQGIIEAPAGGYVP